MRDFLALMNPTRWAVLAGVLGGLLFTLGVAGLHIHAEGKAAGRLEVQAKWDQSRLARAQAENRSLLVQAERIATLSNELTEAQSVHAKTTSDLDRARVGADKRGERVREQTAGDGLDRRLADAHCNVARTFAAGAFRAAAACRDHLAEIGLGAGGLVESSASAHYEHARAEALMRFSMPRSPFTKETP